MLELMEVYCTRPGCKNPVNTISTENINSKNAKKEICCSTCNMPLILQEHFVALSYLGSGGFGKTYKAKDLDFFYTNRVIKQLHPISNPGQILTSEDLTQREEMFKKEAITLENLRHARIPRLFGFFTKDVEATTGYVQRFFYLVQDYIEGENLDNELNARLSLPEPRTFSENEVINILKEILNILKYIHNPDDTNGVIYIHRDIKPANIMRCSKNNRLYLIDFGAVKQILQGLELETTSIVLDPRFAPPEQFRNQQLSPASDLYATATTCLCLLTGNRNPNQLLEESCLKEIVTVSDQHFAKALDLMLKHRSKDRPQSAQEVLKILSGEPDPDSGSTQIPDSGSPPQPRMLRRFIDWVRQLPRRWRSIISLGFSFSLGIAIAVAFYFIFIYKLPVTPPPYANYFSRGEESLIPPLNSTKPSCKEADNFKQEGINAFKKASLSSNKDDFRDAEKFFTQSINKTQSINQSNPNYCRVDPETFIYQYNSKVAQTASARNGSLPTIAVVIPSESNLDIALEILRGVAQVLKEQNTNTPLFQILLVNNNNNKIQDSEKVVNYISNNNIPEEFDDFKNSQILGVLGRYTSRYIWQFGNIYGEKKLVTIATTSTANRVLIPGSNKPNLNDYVFRTASNDSIAAQDLANYMMIQNKVLIAYRKGDPYDPYSDSLKKMFRSYLLNIKKIRSGNIQECDLATDTPQTCIDMAQNEPVNVLMLVPDPNRLQEAIDIVNLANGNFQILAGDVLYGNQTSANKMVVAVPFHADNANDNFKSQTKKLWGIKKVSWRTMTSYDAMQAFVKALTDLPGNANPTRQNIYDNLSDPSFSAPGATTEVRFDQDHDRKAVTGVGVLVQLNKSNPNRDEYGFTLLETPQRNNS
ncbi:bifunctional serine/threonine-protein kinase/ABC transporter substrate-binding protein [Nostoc sp. CHAB 5784]|uniref:bifunctional serine/threonine-protein kinase/ABC transporter substrate-binding protein n=1 Tax=Nostoc mirabile TaxID=2907820 RepID=UPI001E404CD2|nr:bifunctional serine/threonine-protein kinase/ABC transporter substrate-binding protein [Nostoc mirabile]MCC5663802.1 bifunctional serine/threonine-protein kinase/ABC transporter substrate-binding protein [Nostoc mirabile CHAB5784]